MKDFFRIKTLLITLGIIITAILISAVLAFFDFKKMDLSYKIANAAAGGNVFGWAWSENIGWISFNCDHTTDGTLPPNNTNTCGTSGYSVNVDLSTGNFSGHAWSSNVGWIDFVPAADLTTYPGCGFPSAPCETVKRSGNTVTGWAKILALGNDGWLKMSDDSVSVWNGKGVKIDSGTGDFSGWAWNGGGIGWVSFNCSDTSSCATSNYKVHAEGIGNNPPTVSFDPMTDPGNLSYANACFAGALQAFLRWNFSDDPGDHQSAYEVIFDDDSNFSSPIVNTGKISSAATQYSVISTDLDYQRAYYWKVRVWDDNSGGSAVSNWFTGPSFTTYKHEFPDADFSYSPSKPSKDEEVAFTDGSGCYDSDTTCNNWEWTWPAGATFDVTNPQNPKGVFSNSGLDQKVILKVTDGDGYYCEKEDLVDINVALPTWKETKK